MHCFVFWYFDEIVPMYRRTAGVALMYFVLLCPYLYCSAMTLCAHIVRCSVLFCMVVMSFVMYSFDLLLASHHAGVYRPVLISGDVFCSVMLGSDLYHLIRPCDGMCFSILHCRDVLCRLIKCFRYIPPHGPVRDHDYSRKLSIASMIESSSRSIL